MLVIIQRSRTTKGLEQSAAALSYDLLPMCDVNCNTMTTRALVCFKREIPGAHIRVRNMNNYANYCSNFAAALFQLTRTALERLKQPS